MSGQLERGFKLVETLATKGPLAIDEISDFSAIPRSTAYKLLSLLEGLGYVFREKVNGQTDNWYLTLKILRASNLITSRLDLRAQVRDILERLSKETNEIVQLGVLHNDKVMYIDVMKNAASLVAFADVGSEIDINVSAAGRVPSCGLERE